MKKQKQRDEFKATIKEDNNLFMMGAFGEHKARYEMGIIQEADPNCKTVNGEQDELFNMLSREALSVYSTREAAREFMREWKPYMMPQLWNRLGLFFAEKFKND